MGSGDKDISAILHRLTYLEGEVEMLKHELNAGTGTLFLYDAASTDIGTYRQLLQAHSAGAEANKSTTISAAATLIGAWATEAGVPNKDFIPAGSAHFHFHAIKSSGAKNARIYFSAFKRAGAVETLIGTSEMSNIIGSTKSEYDIHLDLNDTDIDTTDRIMLKLYATPEGSGTAPVIAVYYEGTNGTRVEMPFNNW